MTTLHDPGSKAVGIFTILLISILQGVVQPSYHNTGTRTSGFRNRTTRAVVDKDCSEKIFKNFSVCHHKGIYYASDDGSICKNRVDHGECHSGEIIWALNFNMKKHIQSQDELLPRSLQNGTECVATDEMKKLIGTSMSTCLNYDIPICEDGMYELSIVTADFVEETEAYKCYDVQINDDFITRANFSQTRNSNGKQCSKNEVAILFRVYNNRTQLLSMGKKDGISISINEEVEVSICFNYCGNLEGRYPQVRMITVFKFRDKVDTCNKMYLIPYHCPSQTIPTDKICSSQNGDVCQCKKGGCEYSSATKKCVSGKIECSKCGIGCRRANVWYAEGGMLCKNYVSRGDCTINTVVLAVNMNGDAHTDSYGIKYSAFDNVTYASAPDDLTKRSYEERLIRGVPKRDIPLYSTFVSSSAQVEATEECLKYSVPISDIGFYELSIKFGDFNNTEPGKKSVNFRFNGITIVQEMDMLRHSINTNYPTDVNVNFWVEDDAKTLNLPGHLKTPIRNGIVSLDFCHGTCTPKVFETSNWHISAFSIVHFQTAFGSSPAVGKRCESYHANEIACTRDGCEYNEGSRLCTLPIDECPASIFERLACRRDYAYYVDGGKICKNYNDTANACFRGRAVWAQCLNHMYVTTYRGVTFEPLEASTIADPNAVTQITMLSPTCKKILPMLAGLHSKMLQGKEESKFSGSCISIPFTLCQDATYELMITFLNENIATPNKRCFDIKLNNVTVAPNVDPGRLTKGRICTEIELVILFTVEKSATQLIPAGHTQAISINGDVHLDLCYGTCGFEDPMFSLSAFSIVGFRDGLKNCSRCHWNVGKLANKYECWAAGCEFDPTAEICENADISCESKSYRNCLCGHKGCSFYETTAPVDCTPDEPIFQNRLSCRRSHTYYVYHPKTFCFNHKEAGDCSKGNVVYALNLNGIDYVDNHGVKFEAENSESVYDPLGLRLVDGDHLCQIVGTTVEDSRNLYISHVQGDSRKSNSKGKCITYPIQICQNGEYELTLKMAESFYNQAMKRCFDVRINDIPVMSDIDLFLLGGNKKCEAVDIVLMFLMTGANAKHLESQRRIQLKGHSDPITIPTGEIPLQFCFGLCNKDTSFLVSAFSLIRFGSDTEDCRKTKPKGL